MIQIIASVIFGVLFLMYWFQTKKICPEGKKRVPIVTGRLPVVGNGIEFSRDIINYIRQCHNKYGPIFRIKIFRTDMIVVSDNELIEEFFNKKENSMSLYNVLDRLYFADAFADDPNNLEIIIKTVRTSVKVDTELFAPKIMAEGVRMIQYMIAENSSVTNKVNIQDRIINFIARTSARCFISFDMSEDFFATLMKFSHLLNRIVVLTYFIPKRLLKLMFGRTLKSYRKKMIAEMWSTIESYRQDSEKKDSLIIRRALGLSIERNGITRGLTNREIGEIIICLLYVGSENTALGLTSSLLDLSRNPSYWQRVREATKDAIEQNDYRSIFADLTLDSCIMESARMNSHVFALNRQPMTGLETLGDYYVGDADCVALCEPMLMMYESSACRFKDGEIYNPDRFIVDNEKTDAKTVMTWGAGVHLCPGKRFALYEMKVGMAMIVNAFEPFEFENGKKDYFSPSAFAEYSADVKVTKYIPNSQKINAQSKPQNLTVQDIFIQQYTTIEGYRGWLINSFINQPKQKELYSYTKELMSANWHEIESNVATADPKNPCPLGYDNLVYTGTSNCAYPKEWYQVGKDVWDFMRLHVPDFKQDEKKFNSFYSQLFGEKSTLKMHKDQFVTWGISINIGSSAEFTFGEYNIKLHSGDIFIADFSLVDHSIAQVYPNTCPDWFDFDEKFGRCRLSVQIRAIDKPVGNMSPSEFTKLINA